MFEKGQSISAYPIKLISLKFDTEKKNEVKAMFVVPKKKFKHANDRNKLKRRMREAYRLKKSSFYDMIGNASLNLAFIYYSTKEEEYGSISNAFDKLLNKLTKEND